MPLALVTEQVKNSLGSLRGILHGILHGILYGCRDTRARSCVCETFIWNFTTELLTEALSKRFYGTLHRIAPRVF